MDAFFPSHINVWYQATKKPKWNAYVSKSVSGKRRSVLFYKTPIWEFNLPMDNLYEWEVEMVMGFVNKMSGLYDTFYFIDPMNKQTDLEIGTGDGTTDTFRLFRKFGFEELYIEYPRYPQTFLDVYGYGNDGYLTPEIYGYGISVIDIPYIYLDSELQYDGYTLATDGWITFDTPPAKGKNVTATFSFCYKVAFSEEPDFLINYYDGWKTSLNNPIE